MASSAYQQLEDVLRELADLKRDIRIIKYIVASGKSFSSDEIEEISDKSANIKPVED
jgi:hypothetical protein